MSTSVDIVITSRNRPAYVAEAILSAAEQTESFASIIVVDDGSDQPIEQQVKPHLAKMCKFVRNEKSAGVSAARNKGTNVASGDWIVFLDDDDWLCRDYVRELGRFLQAQSDLVHFCWPSRTLVYAATGEHVIKNAPATHLKPDQSKEICFNSLMETGCSGSAFKSDTLRAIGGFDETLVMSEDRDLSFRLLAAGYQGSSVTLARIFIRIHSGERLSTSAKDTAQARSDMQVLAKNWEFLKQNPTLAEKYIGRVAKRLWERDFRKEATHAVDLLCSIRPFSVRARKRQLAWHLRSLLRAGKPKSGSQV